VSIMQLVSLRCGENEEHTDNDRYQRQEIFHRHAIECRVRLEKVLAAQRQARCGRRAQNAVRGVLHVFRKPCAAHLTAQNKEPRFSKAGLQAKPVAGLDFYFGELDESLVVLLECFLWLCFLWVVDLAGADADVSDEGVVVSAANTGPASSNRLTTGTSFLNIDRLHCKE